MTDEELAKQITYALIKDGHVQDYRFSGVFRLIMDALSSRTGNETEHAQAPRA